MPAILYIDDECQTERFQSKKEIIESYGVQVHAVSEITDIFEKLEALRGKIDAIVLDILMPPLDMYTLAESADGTNTGLLVLRDIRLKYDAKIPIIIVSAKPRQESEESIKRHKVFEYLTRPVLPSRIAETIIRALSRK